MMQTALAAGATSSVGRAIAGQCTASGRRVLAIGRDKARLTEVAGNANSDRVALPAQASELAIKAYGTQYEFLKGLGTLSLRIFWIGRFP